VGVIVIYLLAPWRPRFAFSITSFKELIKFGLPYQFNSLLANIKDRGMSAILGLFLGNVGVGYLGTAERISQMPLRFFMDSVTKVSFPAFSRMQGQKKDLEDAVTRSIFFLTFLVYPTVVGMALILPVFIQVFIQYQKWTPALTALNFFVVSVLFAAVTTQLTNLLSAIGKITTVSKLMVMWAVLTLTTVPYFAQKHGVDGAAFGYMLVSASSIVAIYIAKRHVNFSLIEGVGYTILATIGMSVVVLTLRLVLPPSFLNMIIQIMAGAGIYLGIIYTVKGQELLADVKKFVSSFRSR
jgi:O-antigen/teichoic acid export membrane protein